MFLSLRLFQHPLKPYGLLKLLVKMKVIIVV